jgi:hypothetical protein
MTQMHHSGNGIAASIEPNPCLPEARIFESCVAIF